MILSQLQSIEMDFYEMFNYFYDISDNFVYIFITFT